MRDLTVKELRDFCQSTGMPATVTITGGVVLQDGQDIIKHNIETLTETVRAESVIQIFDEPMASDAMAYSLHDGVTLHAPGYEALANVLERAFNQASAGKGAERHAQVGEPFEAQMMQDMAKRFGVGVLLGQAFKKSEESQRLPHDRAVAELLGSIVYLAGAVIHLESKQRQARYDADELPRRTPRPVNDNRPCDRCQKGGCVQHG